MAGGVGLMVLALALPGGVSAAPPAEPARLPKAPVTEAVRPSGVASTPVAAWIHDLPGVTAVQGLSVTLVRGADRKPGAQRLTLGFVDGAAAIPQFAELQRSGATLPSLRIVERKPGPGQNDTEVRLTNVRIVAVDDAPAQAAGATATQQVILGFERIEARMGVSMNPGPPPGSMPVAPAVANPGWLYGLTPGDDPVALAVTSFKHPAGSGEVRVRLAASERLPQPVEMLLAKASWSETLILVLPDARTLKHLEFKFQGGRVTRDGLVLVFRSDDVEILGTNAD